jgi:hypothetical protein
MYRSGLKESIPATCSDVNAEEWVAPDGTDFFKLNGSQGDAKITDIILSAAGVDTRTATIRVNGKLIPEVVLLGANVGTVVNRQFQQTPLYVPSGATLEFTQVT